jgi:hypothetical protein
MIRPIVGTIVFGATLAVAATVAAQAPAPPAGHRLELSGGGGLIGGVGLGSRGANLRGNNVTPQPFPLFTTDSRLSPAALIEARAGIAVTRRFAIEGRFAFSRPELRAAVSHDTEAGSPVTVAERIDQYVIDGSLVMAIDRFHVGGINPFLSVGAGYLRQLHEGQIVIEQGRTYHLGGGVKRWLFARGGHMASAGGIRADASLELLSGGVAFDDRLRPHAVVSGAFFVTF